MYSNGFETFMYTIAGLAVSIGVGTLFYLASDTSNEAESDHRDKFSRICTEDLEGVVSANLCISEGTVVLNLKDVEQ